MSSAAIVGGGITGLTAAFRLRQQGVAVTLYEASGRVGGVIRSLNREGYLAEFGPNTILETSPRISALVRDLGLEPLRLYSDPGASRRYIVRGGRPLSVPGSPFAFFTSSLFSASAKLRLLREPFVPPAPPGAEESVAELVLRRLGQEFLDYAINPLVAGIYAGDPARLSVKHAFPRLHALEQKYGSLIKGQILGARERKRRAEVSKQTAPKVSFRGGLEDLIVSLQQQAGGSLRLNTEVRRIERAGEGWRVVARAEGTEVRAEHVAVLFAAPTHQLARLQIEGAPGISLEPLGDILYPPVASVVLGFRRQDVAHPLDGFGMLIPELERTSLLGTIFSSSLFPGRSPAGHVTLTSYVGGTRAPELASRPEEEIVALACDDLRAILGVAGRPTFQHVVRYPRAIPQYEVGYGRFKDLMSRIETEAPGLFFAGHYRDGISLGDSIVSAHEVAERITQFIATPPVRRPPGRPDAEAARLP